MRLKFGNIVRSTVQMSRSLLALQAGMCFSQNSHAKRKFCETSHSHRIAEPFLDSHYFRKMRTKFLNANFSHANFYRMRITAQQYRCGFRTIRVLFKTSPSKWAALIVDRHKQGEHVQGRWEPPMVKDHIVNRARFHWSILFS